MKKEYWFILVVCLFVTANILEMFVSPLNLSLRSPYQYLDSKLISQYPFTTTIILLRSLGILITPLLVFSYLPVNHLVKGISLFVLTGLSQLYSIQQVATQNRTLPLEWSLAISLACLFILLPIFYQLSLGTIFHLHAKIKKPTTPTQSFKL